MNDYRLIIQVKNNLLYTLMKDKGIETQAELARVAEITPTDAGKVANLKVGAFNTDGRPSKVTEKLCEYFGCLPEDIYPPDVLYTGIPNNVIERVVSSEEVAKYLQQTEIDPAFQLENMIDSKFIKQQLNHLTKRQQTVIKARFFDDKPIWQIACDLDLCQERIRQIEAAALHRLRKVLKHKSDEYDQDSTAAGLATRLADAAKNEQLVRDLIRK